MVEIEKATSRSMKDEQMNIRKRGNKIMNKENTEISILMEYYKNVFLKSNITFWISCIGVVVGIALAFVSVIRKDFNQHILLSSVVIESVSSLLFVFEGRMRKAADDTMRLIRLDNNNLYCERILEKIQDKNVRDNTICEIIEVVIGKS